MKHSLITLVAIALSCMSCYPTRIVTVTPYEGIRGSYNTTVSMPRARISTSTTTHVYAADQDISLYLDLQAVCAAFSQSSSIKEFESLLNNSSYMISNLDLNNDGYVDYLRVVESFERTTHVFIIQAVLGADFYQDVATLVVENPHLAGYHIEIIGDPFIYGPSYYVRPVFISKPVILAHLCRRGYTAWHSPWYWGHFPSYYRHPAPLYLSHYQAYVHTYMLHHRYCREVNYPASCHYPGYSKMASSYMRNDFGLQHPERSFTTRTADIPRGNSAVGRAEGARSSFNALDIRNIQEKTKTTSSSSTRRATTSASPRQSADTPASAPVQRSAGSVSTSGSSTSGSAAGVSGGARRSASTGSGQTTVSSKVRNSGNSDTSIRRVSPSGTESTVKRGSTSSSRSSSNSSSVRSGSSSSGRSGSSSSSRSGSSSSGRSGSSSSTRR